MTDIDSSMLHRHLAPVRQCTPACPDADTLLAFALGQLGDDAQCELIAERVGACAQCAAAVQMALATGDWSEALARDLEAQSIAIQPKVTALIPRSHTARRYWMTAAMAAGIAALVLLVPLLRAPMPDEVLRGTDTIIVHPAHSAVLRSVPLQYRWACADASAAATFELLDAAAVRVWSGATEGDCSARIPADVAAGLGTGVYLWRLLNQSGESIAGPFEFRVAR